MSQQNLEEQRGGMEKTGGEGMLDVGKSVLRLSVNYVDIRFIASTAGLTNLFFFT